MKSTGTIGGIQRSSIGQMVEQNCLYTNQGFVLWNASFHRFQVI